MSDTLRINNLFTTAISNVLYTSLADSGQTAASMTTSGMPGTAPSGSVISGTYRLTAGASAGAAVMRLSSFTYTAGTVYNFTFTGMQGSQTLALYVYQYNAAGTASIQISSDVYTVTTSAATISGSFTANLYPATYTGTIVFYFQALAVNQYVNFTTFSMTTGAMNVGIGTTNASSILDVRPVGTGDAPSYGISHYFPSTYSATVYANQLVASLRFKWYADLWDISGIRGGGTNWQSLAIRYNGTEFLTVGANGNVGIGTTNPGYLLTVGAVATPTANSAGTTVIQCNGNLNVYRNRLIFSGTPTDWNHCIYNNNHNLDNEGAWDGMKFNVYNGAWFRVGTAAAAVPTTAMYINASGQVGIGAAYASASFHVHGDGTSYIMAQLNEIKIVGNGNSHWSIFGARSGHGYFSIANTSVSSNIGTAGTDVLYINNSNQVGIGTAPATKLHIYDSATNVIRMQTSASDSAYIVSTYEYVFLSANYTASGVRDNVGRGSAQIVLNQPTAGGIITFNTSPSVNTDVQERMRILSNGNVGIGITNPSVPLQVNGSIVGSRMYSVSGSLTVSTSAVNVYSLSGSQSGFINVYWGNGSALYFFQWIAGVTSVFINQLTYNASYGSVSVGVAGNGPVYITATANITLTLNYVITFNT